MSDLKTTFSHEQIRRSAERALAHECPHVEVDLQAESKADPEEGGLLCTVCAELRQAGFLLVQMLGESAKLERIRRECVAHRLTALSRTVLAILDGKI